MYDGLDLGKRPSEKCMNDYQCCNHDLTWYEEGAGKGRWSITWDRDRSTGHHQAQSQEFRTCNTPQICKNVCFLFAWDFATKLIKTEMGVLSSCSFGMELGPYQTIKGVFLNGFKRFIFGGLHQPIYRILRTSHKGNCWYCMWRLNNSR